MDKSIKAIFDYDAHNDILYMRVAKREYEYSIQNDNFIFDLDKKDTINGIEILYFSKLVNTSKNILSNLRSGNLHIEISKVEKGTLVKLHIHLECAVRNSSKVKDLDTERITEEISVSEPEYLRPANLSLATA